MKIAQLNEESRVLNIFDTDRHVDNGVDGVPIPDDVFEAIWQGGVFGDWKYNNNKFVLDPFPRPEPKQASGSLPSGEIPRSVL